jgi:hypothetical protein
MRARCNTAPDRSPSTPGLISNEGRPIVEDVPTTATTALGAPRPARHPAGVLRAPLPS